jgi:hypothetical protein
MRDEAIAKILALKAYLVVKQAPRHAHDALRAKVERAVHFLEGRDTAESLRRRVFYNLVLAELLRDADPSPYRVAAREDGERLTKLGYADPTPLYMKIVDATTERLTTAHFGDFKSSPEWSHSRSSNSPLAESQVFRGSATPAEAAVQLEASLTEQYDQFLQAVSLDEIMAKHGIN